MSTLTRARICAVGSETDMIRLCRAMLDNCQWLEDAEEDCPELTLEELIAQVQHHAHMEGGDECGFFYGMLAEYPYGDALYDTCRLKIRKHATGLWTALFTYDSETAFQPEDWLRLHNQCRKVPMLALHADWDFGLEKGMKIIAGGRVLDDWERMGETWLWLMANYEVGYPPEEAIERLRKLRKTMEREDFDLTIGELLQSCIDNLEDLHAHTAEPEMLAQLMEKCREERDFEGMFMIHCRIAETELWEIEHHNRWVACLEAVKQAWHAVEGEDA